MNFIMEAIGYPLGWIMWLMYTLIPNYAVALLLFTIATKLMLLPLSIKQQKGSVKMQFMQPKIQELQTKYKSNPQKMQEEMQELYKRENYSMTAGCLPMLIQMPILFGLIDVIYKPLTHIVRVPAEVLATMTEICQKAGVTFGMYAPQLDMLKEIQQRPDLFASLGNDMVNRITSLNMNLFGLDLSLVPTFGFNLLMLIPIISGLTALLSSVISMRTTPNAQQTGGSMKAMMYMMPLMSVWFATMVPVGVGLYWIFSNIAGCVQTVVLNKFWNPKEMADKMRAEAEERAEKERSEKIEAKKLARERGEEVDEKALSAKEINRQKLAEARRRNAEKYGDYDTTDVTDDDLK
ncbi:MAG: YidC/Oxa1 family membrane protein insertase [Angelakisella sp.]